MPFPDSQCGLESTGLAHQCQDLSPSPITSQSAKSIPLDYRDWSGSNPYRQFSSVQFNPFQSLSHVQISATPWTAVSQASLSITDCQSLLKLMSITSVMPSNHLILCRPFSSHLQSFPASGSFQMSHSFTLGGQNIGVSASASVRSLNIQD